MIIKDKFGTKINLQQSKSGKIIIPIGTKTITLSKEDADSFTLYDIEDFDLDLYQKAYNNSFNLTADNRKGVFMKYAIRTLEIELAKIEGAHHG